MQIVDKQITVEELKPLSEKMFGELVKAVVDIEKGIRAIDATLHSDQELLLLDKGSDQKNHWGINLYPHKYGQADWIEFDLMINMRPAQGNRSRGVDDPLLCKKDNNHRQ